MKSKTIEMIQAVIALDEENQNDFAAYEDMNAVKYDFGTMLDKTWMIPRVTTDAAEALKVLANNFDTRSPVIKIVPFGEEDKDDAERKERWAEYHLTRINQRGGASPIRKIPHQAGLYGRVCLQVDYLPYWLPKDKESWTTEQKEQIRQGSFCVEPHDARGVFYSMGKYGLRWVSSVKNLSPEEVIEHWEIYTGDDETGKKVKSAISKIKAEYDKNEDLRLIHVDFTSYERREVSVFITTDKNIKAFEDFDSEDEKKSKDEKRIDILDTENKLGFLNWVVVECDSSPLLASMHKGNLYAYRNLLDTVMHSTIMRRAYPPMTITKTVDGKGKNIDYTGAEPNVNLLPGESIEPFVPPPLDNGIFTLASQVTGQVESALGIKKLGGMEAGGNTQFSTYQASIDLYTTNLEPYKRASEKAVEQIIVLMFRWLKFTGDSLTAYRSKKSSPTQIAGEEIIISPNDFDLERLLVSVELTTKSDKIAAANRASLIKQAGFRIPDAELLAELGYNNPEVLASLYEDEQLKGAALQLLIKKLQTVQDLEAEAQRLKMQIEAQQQMTPPAPPEGNPNAAQNGGYGQMANPERGMPSNPQGQGFNGANGGTPPMMAEPGTTPGQAA